MIKILKENKFQSVGYTSLKKYRKKIVIKGKLNSKLSLLKEQKTQKNATKIWKSLNFLYKSIIIYLLRYMSCKHCLFGFAFKPHYTYNTTDHTTQQIKRQKFMQICLF